MEHKSYFLGIDISKMSFDYKLIDSMDKTLLIGKVSNDSKGITMMLKALRKAGYKDFKYILLGMENTGIYSNPMKIYAIAEGLDLVVANAYDVSNSKGIKREKSDSADAFLIAQYLRKNLPTIRLYKPDSQSVERMKRLQSSREMLVKQKHQMERHLTELKGFISEKEYRNLERNFHPTIVGIEKSMMAVETEIDEIIKADELMETNQEIIESIPGVGHQTAITLICATNNFQTISDPRKIACHAGVVPFKKESGTSVKNTPRVSHLSNKLLKKRLHMAALSAIRWCLPLKLYYERKIAEGKNKMSVLNAVRNKIVHLICALIEKNEKYDENYIKKLV